MKKKYISRYVSISIQEMPKNCCCYKYFTMLSVNSKVICIHNAMLHHNFPHSYLSKNNNCPHSCSTWAEWPLFLIPFYILGQAKGGGLAFLQGNPSSLEQNVSDGNAPKEFLVYINGDHEYVLYDPYGNEANELNTTRRQGLVELEESGVVSFAKTFIIWVRLNYFIGIFNRCSWYSWKINLTVDWNTSWNPSPPFFGYW